MQKRIILKGTISEVIEELKRLQKEEQEEEYFEEFQNEVISRYDEFLYNTEKRDISYGEIAYITSLSKDDLNILYSEIEKALND